MGSAGMEGGLAGSRAPSCTRQRLGGPRRPSPPRPASAGPGSGASTPSAPSGIADPDRPLSWLAAAGRRGSAGRSETDDDRLAFQVVVEYLVAHLAAPARFLVAAERQRRVVDVVGVDPDRARADQRGGLVGLRDVPGPHASGQAVVRVVG